MTHDELAADLAGHLRSERIMVWQNLQLGPSGSPRPDVYSMEKSFVHPNPRAYEVKISRSDFLADVTAGKWISYKKFAGAVTFAAPAGLVDVKDLPATCGLMVRGETGWRHRKAPTIDPVSIPREAWLKLLIDGVEREGPIWRRKRWDTEAFAKKFGAEAARWVADAAMVKERVAGAELRAAEIIQQAEQQAEKIKTEAREKAPELWGQLCDVLEVPHDSSFWVLDGLVRQIRKEKDSSLERRLLLSLRDQINRGLE